MKKRILALALCLSLFAASGLCACGRTTETAPAAPAETPVPPAETAAPPAETAAPETSPAPAEMPDPAQQGGGIGGSPWQTTVVIGNLPPERPRVQDDLYTYFNYDYLAAHQNAPSKVLTDHIYEMKNAVMDILTDPSRTGHELEQLRLFYAQASDSDTLKTQGMTELLPYLDRIDAVGSVEALNTLLTAEDFPFSPFLLAVPLVVDTRAQTIVGLYPDLLFVDVLLVGGVYYDNLDDPNAQAALNYYANQMALQLVPEFVQLGMDEEAAFAAIRQLLDFEIAYGKYAEYSAEYINMEFGECAKARQDGILTSEALCALCPNIPIREILTKLGKGGAQEYSVGHPEWLSALNGLWTEENLETLKLMAKAKLIDETRPYRDPSARLAFMEEHGVPVPDTAVFAFDACDSLDTFAQAIAKLYVDDCLGRGAVDRMTALAGDLVDAYKALAAETPWLNEASRARVLEKLDHMQLNVLEPLDGWFDYSALELTPSEAGGTLLSNYLKLKQYRYDRESELIGRRATVSDVWYIFEPTMCNAFYNQSDNTINLFSGFISSVFWSDDVDDSALLGRLGLVIGHEISHGFDYVGAQFDAYGQTEALFTGSDLEAFLARTDALADYYSAIELMPGLPVDGQLVVAEAAADLSGMQAALYLAGQTDMPDYREFFHSASYIWASTMDETEIAFRILDIHPFFNLRVNVNAQMFKPTYETFDIREGDGMYLAPDERIVIWGPDAG